MFSLWSARVFSFYSIHVVGFGYGVSNVCREQDLLDTVPRVCGSLLAVI